MMWAVLLMAGCAAPPTSENAAGSGSENGDVIAAIDNSGDDPDAMICRREQVTGTNFRRRVCMTRAQREQEQADSQEEMLERRSAVR